jgi:hypothetical protein
MTRSGAQENQNGSMRMAHAKTTLIEAAAGETRTRPAVQMVQPNSDNIEAIERRRWSSADNLRANSNYVSNEYFLPVMGLIFLRHAYSLYLAVKPEIEASLPTRGGKNNEALPQTVEHVVHGAEQGAV